MGKALLGSTIGTLIGGLVLVVVGQGQSSADTLEIEALPKPASLTVDFLRDVDPIFREKCHSCHGPQQQSGGLRLDSRAAALAGGYSGPVIKPGDSAHSKLIHLVAGVQKGLVMPMSGEPLTTEQVGLLRTWIDQGAEWAERRESARPGTGTSGDRTPGKHWSFIPPRSPQLPAVQNEAWVRNPIDRLVLAKLEEREIQPSPEADRATLIRRLSLDLIGLPPTLQEVDHFLADRRTDAYEHLVDRLLASRHYGEKWARHWLDLARYADSDGYEKDKVRPHAWRWRHWVIEALNRNMPFDQFTIEQIAGDLLPEAGVEQKVATGFNRNTLTNREGGVDKEEFRVEQVVDRVSTLATVWMGLTLGCARCHDHKYDPISQQEFYQLYAFFNSAVEVNLDAPVAGEMGPFLHRKPEYDQKREALLAEYKVPELQAIWEDKLRNLAGKPNIEDEDGLALLVFLENIDRGLEVLMLDLAERTPNQKRVVTDHFIHTDFKELSARLKKLDEEYPGLSQAQTLVENAKPPKSHVLVRGNFQQPGIEVHPATPEILPPLPAGGKPSRLTLARWLVSRNHPLTARVTVNRMWQELLGVGLVETSEDFGVKGDLPTHPELLDWLATEFMAGGWNLKQMHKLMVESATYRQSSKTRKDLQSLDPDNKLLARQTRVRLSAELVRDSALFVGGLLNPLIGGKSVRPPQPEGVADLSFRAKWKDSQGADRYRRGVYILFQRSIPYPQLATFDAPDSLNACSRREQSTTPLQALTLLNDPVFFEAAQGLAVRVLLEKPGELSTQLDYAFRLCMARPPTVAEKERLLKYFQTKKTLLSENGESPHKQFPIQGLEGVDAGEAAAWLGVSRVLLNLAEFITRG